MFTVTAARSTRPVESGSASAPPLAAPSRYRHGARRRHLGAEAAPTAVVTFPIHGSRPGPSRYRRGAGQRYPLPSAPAVPEAAGSPGRVHPPGRRRRMRWRARPRRPGCIVARRTSYRSDCAVQDNACGRRKRSIQRERFVRQRSGSTWIHLAGRRAPSNESSIGYCLPQANSAFAFCQFVLPGTFSVSVTVEDENGLDDTATAPVTVNLPNGYIGVVLFSGRPHAEAAEAYRVVLRIIDWQKVRGL